MLEGVECYKMRGRERSERTLRAKAGVQFVMVSKLSSVTSKLSY